MKSKATFKVLTDLTDKLGDIVDKFRKDKVLVGIPEEKDSRQSDKIGNAGILAINNFGSPANNIPAWPVLQIGIDRAKKEITEQFKRAAKEALSGGATSVSAAYQRAGIVAASSVKKTINEQIDAPALKSSTLAARERKGFKGEKRLIVTGQVRNAITYVVKEG